MNKSASRTGISDRVSAFALEVIEGRIVAGPDVRHTCQRHLNDLKNGVQRGLRWDQEAANLAIGYFEDVLCLNGGEYEGLPFLLLPWQSFIVGSLFGWKGSEGFRRFRTAYIETVNLSAIT